MNKLKFVLRGVLLLMFVLSLQYERIKINSSIDMIPYYEDKFQNVKHQDYLRSQAMEFSSIVLEDSEHLKENLYFQSLIMVLFLLSELTFFLVKNRSSRDLDSASKK
jgi:hypothetical protein